jgi:hypothetical protein
LMISARAIDAYAKSREPSDNVDDFLAWAERCRRQR